MMIKYGVAKCKFSNVMAIRNSVSYNVGVSNVLQNPMIQKSIVGNFKIVKWEPGTIILKYQCSMRAKITKNPVRFTTPILIVLYRT